MTRGRGALGWLAAVTLAVAGIACSLNPQPLPPLQPDGGADTFGAPDAAVPATSGSPDAGVAARDGGGDTPPPSPPDAGSGDASVDGADGAVDGGEDGATDAGDDAPADATVVD